MPSLSLNSRVKVSLTDKGGEVYKQWREEAKRTHLTLAPPHVRQSVLDSFDDRYLRTDQPVEVSLWELMSVFGPFMRLGMDAVFEEGLIHFGEDKHDTAQIL